VHIIAIITILASHINTIAQYSIPPHLLYFLVGKNKRNERSYCYFLRITRYAAKSITAIAKIASNPGGVGVEGGVGVGGHIFLILNGCVSEIG